MKLVHSDALDSELEGVEWVEYAHYYIARLWRTTVSSYTSLGITKHRDRLPAMGGSGQTHGREEKVCIPGRSLGGHIDR